MAFANSKGSIKSKSFQERVLFNSKLHIIINTQFSSYSEILKRVAQTQNIMKIQKTPKYKDENRGHTPLRVTRRFQESHFTITFTLDSHGKFHKIISKQFIRKIKLSNNYLTNYYHGDYSGAPPPGTAGTAVAVPEFPIILSVFGDTFHFVGKPTNLVGF